MQHESRKMLLPFQGTLGLGFVATGLHPVFVLLTFQASNTVSSESPKGTKQQLGATPYENKTIIINKPCKGTGN